MKTVHTYIADLVNSVTGTGRPGPISIPETLATSGSLYGFRQDHP